MPNAGSRRVEVLRTYLELRAAAPLPQMPDWPPGVTLVREERCSVALSRTLYVAVGRAYRWFDRDAWPDEQLAAYLAQPQVSLWVLREKERPLGYFELHRENDSIEIAYFGLVAEAQGRGLGKRLLQAAVAVALGTPVARVWLHTCTLDHAAALPNYLARGFVPFRSERYEVAAPDLA